jgi:hypothetical protein
MVYIRINISQLHVITMKQLRKLAYNKSFILADGSGGSSPRTDRPFCFHSLGKPPAMLTAGVGTKNSQHEPGSREREPERSPPMGMAGIIVRPPTGFHLQDLP